MTCAAFLCNTLTLPANMTASPGSMRVGTDSARTSLRSWYGDGCREQRSWHEGRGVRPRARQMAAG